MGSFGFSVTIDWRDGTVLVCPTGDLDVMTAPELDRVLGTVMDGAPGVVLDLSDVRFVDCAGLAPIRRALQAGARNRTSMRVVGARPQVQRVMRLTGL